MNGPLICSKKVWPLLGWFRKLDEIASKLILVGTFCRFATLNHTELYARPGF
jgi:hypothetical protein